MVSTLIANGKVVLGAAGEWSSGQADAILTAYFKAAGWSTLWSDPVKQRIIPGFFGKGALDKNLSVKVPEWSLDLKHAMYTGIRLAQIKDDPDFYEGACNAHVFMREDPACGFPGPHPVVFDELAKRLGKSDPEATWGPGDTTRLCSTAERLFFNIPASCPRDSGCQAHECLEAGVCRPMAYRPAPSHQGACEMVYGVLPNILGEMTTAELKAFLTEDKFPAAFADKVKEFPVMEFQ